MRPPKSRTSGQSATAGGEKSVHSETEKTANLTRDTVEPGEVMTGNQGVKISDDQNSLKAGGRGPTLMEDFHLREKLTHFDHERIPERVVHARGAAAHGVFQVYEDLSDLTKAGLLGDPSRQTPVFVRFSTVAGRVGPNFAELPINRPLDSVHNNQRDGMARTVINKGRVSYFPNRLGGGCPMQSPEAADAFVSYAEKVDGAKIRARSDSFSDHFSQASQFWNSMSDWEQQHIVEAFSFELNQVESEEVRHHVMNELLVNIADALAEAVSAQTGIKVAPVGTPGKPTPSAPTPSGPLRPQAKGLSSPALSQDKPGVTVKGRKIAILAGEGVDAKQLKAVTQALTTEGAVFELIAAHAGTIAEFGGQASKGQPRRSKRAVCSV